MHEPSRRSLLLSSGAGLALSLAGCLGQAAPASDRTETPTDDADGPDQLPDGLDRAFEYVYGDGNGAIVRILRHEGSGSEDRMGIHPTLDGVGDPAWLVYVQAGTSGQQRGGLVATGTFDVEGDQYTADGSRADFDRYRLESGTGDSEERLLLSDGERILMGPPDWIDGTLSQHESGSETYIESTPGARALLGYAALDRQTVLVNDDQAISEPFQGVDVDESAIPSVLAIEYGRTDETLSYTIAGRFAETPDADDAETLSAFLQSQLSIDDPTVEIHEGDQVVVARGSRAYTPPEERPETASIPRFVEYDENTGAVLFRIEDGEQLPVDRYEIEIEDEVYTGDWARGKEQIGAGDTIAIDADAIEPGDSFSIRYESPDGSYGSSGGTSALSRLPFAVDYDPDAGSATVTYADGPPLAGDRVVVTVGDDERTLRPWDGEITEGDSVTLSDLPMDSYLRFEYERADGETVPIGGGGLDAPGEFDVAFDAQAETVTITYPDRDAADADRPPVHPDRMVEQPSLEASRYEITVDGEPASQQWADSGDRIEPGDSLRLTGIPVDTEIAVASLGADGTRHEVTSRLTIPDVEFEFTYDSERNELTIHHAGGPGVDPGPLSVEIHAEDERTEDWTADGTVTDGDSVVLEDLPDHGVVVVNYRDRHLAHANVGQLREHGSATASED
jgi:hypothetical protein